ncbi:sugar phosphate isomerase/epimerase family protein [Actinotignum sp. GS-2025a]|uniref:sugar phosphate isomerase/epimerase family protein n=1 Tax=unclassified Actinotignum TaxID=2632702 RepID=UPI003F47311F
MYTADTWPIAAKMNFGSRTETGEDIATAPLSVWEDQLLQVKELGFSAIDPMDDWVPLVDLPEKRFASFRDICRDLDLSIPAISVGRRSVVDVRNGDANLAFVHDLIDRGHELGAQVINIGFMEALTPAQEKALWFWLAPGHVCDPQLRPLAIERVRELARHAGQYGMQISLEMYEDTYVGTHDGAVRFVRDIDRDNVGLNPDIGNLIRLHRPMPSYQEMFDAVLPYANYWHIKNYIRDEDPETGTYMSAPVPLESGLINYRAVIRQGLRGGFTGAFMVEHYGSDWLGVGATNARYIRQVLRSALRTIDPFASGDSVRSAASPAGGSSCGEAAAASSY